MSSLIQRFPNNPILRPSQVTPSHPDLEVACVLNPAAFEYQGRVGLLLRVAERPSPVAGRRRAIVRIGGGLEMVEDEILPGSKDTDSRAFELNGKTYLSTLSHLRLAWSDDGIHFEVAPGPFLQGDTAYEEYGVEDPRVWEEAGVFWITYTAVSPMGVTVMVASTRDWKSFERHGVAFAPHNKDVALFSLPDSGRRYALHRPCAQGFGLGGLDIWLAEGTDWTHWGNHQCIARTRPGCWDEQRIGAGAAPILTEQGWLCIYHGANRDSRYCLGALLLDLKDPSKVLARSKEPLMSPEKDYETRGFFGNVVFTNGHVVKGDVIHMYYGSADEYVCGADLTISGVLKSLEADGC